MDDDGVQRMRMAAHHAALTAAFLQQASVASPHGSTWPVDPWPMLASMAAAAQLGGASVPMQPAATYAAAFPQLPRSMPYPSGSLSARPAAGNPHVLGPDMWQAIFGGWTSSGLHPNAVLSTGAQPPVCSAAVVPPSSYFNVVSRQLGVMEGEDHRTGLRPVARQQAIAVGASNSTVAVAASADGAGSTSAANTIGVPRDQASPVGSCRHAFRTGSLHAFSPYSRSRVSSHNSSSAPSDTCLDLSVPRAADSFSEHRPSPVATTASDMAPAPVVLSEAATSLAVMTSGSGGCGIRAASTKSERESGRKAPIPVGIAVAWQRRQEPVDNLTRETATTVSKGDFEGQPLMPTTCDGRGLPEPVDDCTTVPIQSQLCLENSLSPDKTAHHRKVLAACAMRCEDRQVKVKDDADAATRKTVVERALQSKVDPIASQAAILPEGMAQAAIEERRKMLAEGDKPPGDIDPYSSCDILSEDSTKEGKSDDNENNDGSIGMRLVSEEAATLDTTPDLPMLSVVQAASPTGEFGRKRKESHSAKSQKKKKKKHSSKESRGEGKKLRKKQRKLGNNFPPDKERTVETSVVSLQVGSSGFPPGDREQSGHSPLEQLPVDDASASTVTAESGRLTESNENDSVHVRYGQVSYDLTDDQSLLALCKSFSQRKLALEEAKVHYKEQHLRLGLELAKMETGQQAATSGSEVEGAAASSGISARSSATSRSNLRLSVEDLTEGARLLIFIRGLPHEGTVVCLEPPSVYGVVLASQRSARPRVYAREDLLRDAVRDVQPTRADDLRHGSRVCAYWSSQFDCLYPGVVVKVLRPESAAARVAGSGLGQATRSKLSRAKAQSGKVLVEITFDDRDSGTFVLEQIRMLPTDFPHTPTQFEFANGDDDVLSVVPAERRLRSSSRSTAAAAAVTPPSGLSPAASIAGPQSRCHPRSCRNRQAAESATDSSRGFSESDDEPLNMLSKRAGVPSTSSSGSGSEWVWSGSPARSHGTAAGSHGRRRSDKVFYSAIRRGHELLKVGDCAVFARREENMPPFVGTILSMWQGRRRMTVRVQWFYHPEEIEDDSVTCGNRSLIGALFESKHEDEVNVQSILHRCEVLPMAVYRERRLHRRTPADVIQHAVFCIVGSYDAVGGRVTNVLDLAAVATEEVASLDTASRQVHD